MALAYGFVKATINGAPFLKAKRMRHEIQYHVHVPLDVGGAAWDVAINVGTNDADDLLQYKLVFDYHHAITDTLAGSATGQHDLTGTQALPALDFLHSDILAETGAWRPSDVMDGSLMPEPVASMMRLLARAQAARSAMYVFGRFYTEGNGIHDTHMNQGSQGPAYQHREGDDSNDHNDVWQDGALMVALDEGWAAYFAAFQQQLVPTDDLGNPTADAAPIGT